MSAPADAKKIRPIARDAAGRPLEVIAHAAELSGEYGRYIADPGLINAANTALGLQLPLLLTGEPGCGKSDFAWAAAHALGRDEPHCCYIRSDTRARDLLYHYDALRRFGDAQHGEKGAARDPRAYIRLRPLGVALMTASPRQVVLIDEIDKAPRDLPNDLLHEIDAGSFEIAELDGSLDETDHADHPKIPLKRRMTRLTGARRPLIIITSNAERQLPEPFLRRCVFYHIPPPTPARLLAIASARFGDQGVVTKTLTIDLQQLVDTFAGLRLYAEAQRLTKPPTTSEMLEWIRACIEVYEPADVADDLRATHAALDRASGRLSKESGRSWAALPGITCLIKHREDLRAIAGHGAG